MGLARMLLRTRTGFEQIVLRYRQRVYGYAYHMLGDADEAADVTQDVFLKLWSSRDKMEEKRVLAWLLFVTRNACIDQLRHRRTVRAVVDRNEHALDVAMATDERPDAALEGSDLRSRLQEALHELSEPYRSIVILREIQDLSYAEISGALNLPLTTVKVYLHRGRKMLRERVSGLVSSMAEA